MNKVTMEELTSQDYWTTQIEIEGIEAVEEIITNDRTLPGADIYNARQRAIDSYHSTAFIGKLKEPKYLIGIVLLLVAVFLIYKIIA